MGKHKKKPQESESEEIEDVMAWGKSRNNYYRQDEDEYSNASQQQMEARQIYEKQLNVMNQDQFYEVAESEGQQEQNLDDEQAAIDKNYIESEILWATQLAKLLEGISDDKKAFRKKIYDGYLLILLCLKQFDIPYIQQHPLVSFMPSFKKALKKLQNDIPNLYQNAGMALSEQNSPLDGEQNQEDSSQIDGEQIDEEGEQFSDEMDQNQEQMDDEEIDYEEQKNQKNPKKNKIQFDDEGIQIYESIKQKKDDQRKQKKIENKQKRQQSLPKQKFKVVEESEGRLANQKILKNKGLMKKRKKIDGNSRVKLREKYRKALIKRKAKGIIGVKENPGRHYEGEEKVLMGKIGSRKLK